MGIFTEPGPVSAQCVVGTHQMLAERQTVVHCLCHHLCALWSECGTV